VKSPLPLDKLSAAAEATVVALAAGGDNRSFEELVRRRQATVRQLLRRLSRNDALADDLAQQVFLQAWRSLDTLRAPGAFGGWLRKLAANAWLQHVRRRREEVELDEGAFESGRAPMTSERLDLDGALAHLPHDMRLCVVLAYSEGLSHSEIVEVSGLPLGTVKSHIARGATRLRTLLEAYEDKP
jgi:RNA polymerase sigma-70 factor (ECF subfamily)